MNYGIALYKLFFKGRLRINQLSELRMECMAFYLEVLKESLMDEGRDRLTEVQWGLSSLRRNFTTMM